LWAVGGPFIIKATSALPGTWTQQSAVATTGASLRGCIASDATHAWAYGSNGAVFATSDGTNWAKLPMSPTTTQTLQAGAGNGSTLTFVGTGGVLYRSVDNGASFAAELAGVANPLLTSIYGLAPGVAFAVGGKGTILRTSDDGRHWTALAVPAQTGTSSNLTGVFGLAANDVYAVGAAGTLLHSGDGTTFTRFSGSGAPTATTIFTDVWGSPELGVFAAGYDSSFTSRVLFRTVDHGASWSFVSIAGFTGNSGVLETVFVLGSDVWLGDGSGNILHSIDGLAYDLQETRDGGAFAVSRIRGLGNDLVALVPSDPGGYLHSTNKGGMWSVIGAQFNDSPTQMFYVPDGSAIYVFGAFSPVVSVDNKVSWHLFDPGIIINTAATTRNGFAFAANDIFVVGDTGIIHYGP
jgi:photosystem II stability/assembly factor-like uncharacterized protein